MISDAGLHYAAMAVWNGVQEIESDAPSRCAPPGAPRRNSVERCQHGFARGLRHIACPVCEPARWHKLGEDYVPHIRPQSVSIELPMLRAVREGPRYKRDIAIDFSLTKTAIHERYRRLVRDGLVASVRGLVGLTDAGRKRLAELEAAEERAPEEERTQGARSDGECSVDAMVGLGSEVSR